MLSAIKGRWFAQFPCYKYRLRSRRGYSICGATSPTIVKHRLNHCLSRIQRSMELHVNHQTVFGKAWVCWKQQFSHKNSSTLVTLPNKNKWSQSGWHEKRYVRESQPQTLFATVAGWGVRSNHYHYQEINPTPILAPIQVVILGVYGFLSKLLGSRFVTPPGFTNIAMRKIPNFSPVKSINMMDFPWSISVYQRVFFFGCPWKLVTS